MKTLSLRVTNEEACRIRGEAARMHMSVSQFLRSRALGSTDDSSGVKMVKCALTGAMIFGPLPDAAPLTNATVKAMLDAEW